MRRRGRASRQIASAVPAPTPGRAAWHRLARQARLLAWACGALVLGSSPAHAYLDPGTGSILLQVILGAIAAGAAALVSLRARIGALLAGLRARKKTPTSTKDAADGPSDAKR